MKLPDTPLFSTCLAPQTESAAAVAAVAAMTDFDRGARTGE